MLSHTTTKNQTLVSYPVHYFMLIRSSAARTTSWVGLTLCMVWRCFSLIAPALTPRGASGSAGWVSGCIRTAYALIRGAGLLHSLTRRLKLGLGHIVTSRLVAFSRMTEELVSATEATAALQTCEAFLGLVGGLVLGEVRGVLEALSTSIAFVPFFGAVRVAVVGSYYRALLVDSIFRPCRGRPRSEYDLHRLSLVLKLLPQPSSLHL